MDAMGQAFCVIGWLIIVTLLQLSIYPQLKKIFSSYAFPAAFSVSILIFTLLTWYCGLVRVPVQAGLVPFIALLAWNLYHRNYSFTERRAQWRWELVFIVCFLLMLDVRFVNPTISYAEKFMDHAFLASVIRDPVIPPLDPWFAGGTLDVYYYLGYWIVGCLAIVSGVPSNIAFNLGLPTVFALAAVNIYAIGTLLLKRFALLPLLVVFIPNPSFFCQVIAGKSMNAVVWDSTRTIANTINEYPFFSFIWGDLHAHVVSIFNQAFLIFLLLFLYLRWESLGTRSRLAIGGCTAMSLGAMPLINTWDVLIYAPITVIVLLLIVMRSWRTTERNQSLAGLFSIPVASILAYIPFYLQLKAHTGGISNVRAPSDPIEFLLVNGFFIAVIVAFLYRDIAKRPWLLAAAVPFALPGYMAAAIAAIPLVYLIHRLLFQDEKDAAELLAIFGLMILIACELIYMKDSMGETYFRMNTIFKCYLPAWILLSISISAMIGRALAGILPVIPPWSARALAAIGIAALFILPFMIPFNAGYGTGTLDGLEYISNTHPGDAGAVAYLRTLGGNEVIVEAEGGDYTYSSRVSSFTGIPAIIGMPFHEYMWRGDDTGWFAARPGEIKTIYEKPGQAAGLMRKYNATLLYVGDSERDRYKVSLPGEGFEKVYSAQGTEIYWLGA